MAIWKDSSPAKKDAPVPAPEPATLREAPPVAGFPPAAASSDPAQPAARGAGEARESLIAADLSIEGKIEGVGHVRIAGRFKGDVNVQGDLTIEKGAVLTGGVRARRVVVAGELEGNIEAAAQVELQASGMVVGDVRAGSLTVAAGSRMRGQAEFGWEEKTAAGRGTGDRAKMESGAGS